MTYTTQFTGSVVQPSDVMYTLLTLTGNTNLAWPSQYNPSNPSYQVVARTTEVTTNAAGYILYMPPANQIGVGYDVMFRNVGGNPFIVADNSGNQIVQIAPGLAWYVYVRTNSTVNGTWGSIQQGAGTSAANASALAGTGLIPLAGLLNTNFPSQVLLTDYTVQPTDNGKLFISSSNAGSYDITLPTGGSIPNGFYIAINNSYTSNIINVVTTDGSLIDKLANFKINGSQSSYFIWNQANGLWATVGYGQQTNFNYQNIVLSVAGNLNVELSPSQYNSAIQKFTGLLTGNITVIYPQIPGEWIVTNATTGAFTLSVLTVNSPTPLQIPQGQTLLVYSDGSNMFSAPTTIPGSAILFPDGSFVSPSITFSSDQDTGLYRPAANTIGITTNGVNRITIGNATSTFTNNVSIGNANTLTVGTGSTTLGGALTVTGITNLSTLNTSGLATLNSAAITTPLGITSGGTGLSTIGPNNTYLRSNGITASWSNLLTPNIVTTYYTNTTNSFAAGTGNNVFSGTITPQSLNSRIQILVQVNVSLVGVADPIAGLSILRGAVNFYTGDARGSNAQFSVVCRGTDLQTYVISVIDSPNTTAPVTYNLAISVGAAVGTIASINYVTTDPTTNAWGVGASSMILTEIYSP